ncbi:MAG: polysaccharide pyruvyl transferase family protein [Planctomycetota bacterium]
MRTTEQSFVEVMAGHAGKRVFFEPLCGNNGDRLIRMGAERVFERAEVTLVDEPGAAELIVINGGGAMNDVWGGGIGRLEHYRGGFPGTPIVVGPSTFEFETDRFAKICASTDTPITLFGRDRTSHAAVTELGLDDRVTLGLSQDLAFELKGGPWVEEQRAQRGEGHVVVCMRKDKEGGAKLLAQTKAPWLPAPIRKPLSRLRDRLVASGRKRLVDRLIEEAGVDPKLPRVVRDISVSVDFEAFCEAIRGAAFIMADRMHVSILGYLLDKPTVLLAGAYHKNASVHAFSMAHEESCVRFVDPKAGAEGGGGDAGGSGGEGTLRAAG